MAPYLTTVAIGNFNIAVGRTPGRVPIITGVDPRLAAGSAASLARIGEVVDWETSLFGPYPFESVGAIVDYAPDVGPGGPFPQLVARNHRLGGICRTSSRKTPRSGVT